MSAGAPRLVRALLAVLVAALLSGVVLAQADAASAALGDGAELRSTDGVTRGLVSRASGSHAEAGSLRRAVGSRGGGIDAPGRWLTRRRGDAEEHPRGTPEQNIKNAEENREEQEQEARKAPRRIKKKNTKDTKITKKEFQEEPSVRGAVLRGSASPRETSKLRVSA
jgi:hypothetical protein